MQAFAKYIYEPISCLLVVCTKNNHVFMWPLKVSVLKTVVYLRIGSVPFQFTIAVGTNTDVTSLPFELFI